MVLPVPGSPLTSSGRSSVIAALTAIFRSSTLAIGAGNFVQADTTKPTFGSWGLDTATMDKKAKPGDDFFRYMEGHWLDTATIPADRTFNGVDNVINDELNRRMRTIVDARGATARGPQAGGAEDRRSLRQLLGSSGRREGGPCTAEGRPRRDRRTEIERRAAGIGWAASPSRA
jgi:hypothetical protein